MRDWLNEQESVTKYGTPAYAGWKQGDAQADWNAKHPGVPGITTPTATQTTSTATVPLTFEGLMNQITTSSTGYPEAIKAEEARLPLIQQRYKALLDEITLTEEQGKQETKAAETSQIGETQARAAAQGIFPSTTELGAEENTRQAALKTILGLGKESVVAKAKALADQATEEGDVSAAIAKLKIDKSTTETERYATALDYLLKKQQIDKGTGDETKKAKLTASLTGDVAAGATVKDLIKLYAPEGVSLREITDAYNKGSRYGAFKESIDELSKLYNQYALSAADYLEYGQIDVDSLKTDIMNDDEYKNGNWSDDQIRAIIRSKEGNPDDVVFAPLFRDNPANEKSNITGQGVLDYLKKYGTFAGVNAPGITSPLFGLNAPGLGYTPK